MDFRSIEVLIWLVKDPNLKRTAERLRVTQPTLTKRLAQLEEHVGESLFERRGSQGLWPTANALKLAESAKEMLDNWSYAMNMVKMKSATKSFLSLDGPTLFMQLIIAPIWARSKLYSENLVHIRNSPVAELGLELSGKELDAAFLFDKNQAMDFKFAPVCREQMGIIYNSQCKITPEAMLRKKDDGLNWLSYRPDRDPLTLLTQADILPKKNVTGFFEDLPTLIGVIENDPLCATVLPMHSVLYSPERLRVLPLPNTEQTIYFVYRPDDGRDRVFKEFSDFVIKELKGHPYLLPV